MIIINQYEWLFDAVEFGIDLRDWRLSKGMTQAQVDASMGLSSRGSYCSAIECGRVNGGMSMRLFLAWCALLDADPRRYFTIQAV